MHLQPRQHRKFSNIPGSVLLMARPKNRPSKLDFGINPVKDCNLKVCLLRAECVFFPPEWSLELTPKHEPSLSMSHSLSNPPSYLPKPLNWMARELQLSPRLVSEVPEDLQTPLRKARPIDQSNEKSHPCDLSRGRCSLLRRLERNGSVCAVHWGYERSRKTDAKPQPVWQGHCHSVPSVLPLKYCSTHPVLERFAVLREGDQMYPNDEAWYHDIGLQAYHLCQNKSSTSVFCRPLEHQKRWLLKCV